jgi:hypothetical protein
VDSVNLVAHSYGGLISRSYIQGNSYRGDVTSLTEMGTPNQGAVKVYSIWEGADMPKDWAAAEHLIRLYQFKLKNSLTRLQVVRQLFPSIHDLVPTYPAIVKESGVATPDSLIEANSFLLTLNKEVGSLFRRVSVHTYVSETKSTLTRQTVGKGGDPFSWPDGRPFVDKNSMGPGDSTVPIESALLPGSIPIKLDSYHNQLPALAVSGIIKELYPGVQLTVGPTKTNSPSTLYFLFDCPVDVKILLPNGELFDTTKSNKIGEIERSNDLIWIVLPRLNGQYLVTITALADTPVRDWLEFSTIREVVLKKGEVVSQYAVVELENSPEISEFIRSSPPIISVTTSSQITSSTFPDLSPVPAVEPELQNSSKVLAVALPTQLVVSHYNFSVPNITIPNYSGNQSTRVSPSSGGNKSPPATRSSHYNYLKICAVIILTFFGLLIVAGFKV